MQEALGLTPGTGSAEASWSLRLGARPAGGRVCDEVGVGTGGPWSPGPREAGKDVLDRAGQ